MLSRLSMNSVKGLRLGSTIARSFSSSTKALKSTYDSPDFTSYLNRSKGANPDKSRDYTYFMVGAYGVLGAAAAKSTVDVFLSTLSASADVLAMSKVEVKLGAIPLGENAVVKWQGKPVFIRHRTPEEIQEANGVDISTLRDPQKDADRVIKPEWLIMVGVCTHLGCVPIGNAGDYDGWFCPCHGSHYDISGRIRKGPAPLNLEIPHYKFADDSASVLIG